MAFSIVSLRIAVTYNYLSTLNFHPCLNFESFKELDVHLTDPAETIGTASDDCVYDTHN